ncbi:hypothetical protein ACFL4T_04880 [candidate division KSB1 bacterium]
MRLKTIYVIGSLLLAVNITFSCNKSNTSPQDQVNFTDLTGEYLGQTPPGNTPVLFGSGTVSRSYYFEHSPAVFTPDKKEVYWSALRDNFNKYRMYYIKMIDNRWTAPQEVQFFSGHHLSHPVLSHDGNVMYFNVDHHNGIWKSERTENGWSEPEKLPYIINSSEGVTIYGITSDGSIYFARPNLQAVSMGGMSEICVSRLSNGQYTEPERLDENINSDNAQELSIFIAPDESYMIMEQTLDNRMCELFISYRKNDNSWTERINLSLGWSRFPYVSPDGKYLFFMGEEGIYWVNTSFIENLKPDELK